MNDLPPKEVLDAFQCISASLDGSMCIVTCSDGTENSGCLVGFCTQISVYPPRFIVGLSVENHSFTVAQGAGHLALHFPSQDNAPLVALFGGTTGDEVEKFDHCRWRVGPHGAPILEECGNWVVGRILQKIEAGDHHAFLLHVEAAHCTPGARYIAARQVRDLEPGHEVATPTELA